MLVRAGVRDGRPPLAAGLMNDSEGQVTLIDSVVSNNVFDGLFTEGGGSRLTQALLAGSPADDAEAPLLDQRGVSRPQGAAADIGAYERDQRRACRIILRDPRRDSMKSTRNIALVSFSVLAATALGFGAVGDSAEEGPNLPTIVLDGGEGESIAFPPHPTSRLAGPDTNLAGMSFFEIQVAAGTPGAPPHTHAHEDEFFYVREGTVTFLTGEETTTIGPGGFVLLPRHSLHGLWNVSDEDAILLVGTSEGKFGDFFDAVAMEAQQTKAASPQDLGAIMGRLGAERGIVIDMSKIPEDVAALYGL